MMIMIKMFCICISREAGRAESNASGQAAMPGNSPQCRQEKKHCRKKTIQIAVEKHQALQVHCLVDVVTFVLNHYISGTRVHTP